MGWRPHGFKAKLFRYPGPGGWTFAIIPGKHAPPATHAWERTLLPVPKQLRDGKGDGDVVLVELALRDG